MNEFQRKLYDMCRSDSYLSLFAQHDRDILNIEPFTYSIDGNVLSANITQTAPQVFNLPMDANNDFVVTGLSGFGRAAGGSVMIINPAILIQIRDQAAARNFFNQAAPMPFICGQGGFPYLLGNNRLIRARTTLQITAISAEAQSFSGFYLTFHGGKIYYA